MSAAIPAIVIRGGPAAVACPGEDPGRAPDRQRLRRDGDGGMKRAAGNPLAVEAVAEIGDAVISADFIADGAAQAAASEVVVIKTS